MKKAFTLIEVIIAITVFAIGVLAVLRLITQNLVTLDATQSRTTATFLAKEGMELVYNMRDSNIDKGLPWDCVLKSDFTTGNWGEVDPDAVCERYFSSGSQDNRVLQVSFDPQKYIFSSSVPAGTNFLQLWSGNRLYYTTGSVGGYEIFWYSSRPLQGGNATFFSRYILFTGVREGTALLPRESILKVESHVSYSKGAKTGEVILESFIGNY